MTNNESPWAEVPERVTATIKYGDGGFNSSWQVFHGTVDSVKSDIILSFGLTEMSNSTNTLHEVVLAAEAIAHDGASAKPRNNCGRGAAKKTAAKPAAPAAEPSHEEAKATVEQELGGEVESEETKAHPFAALLASIEEAPDQKRLLQLFKANPEAHKDPEVKAAVKARMTVVG